MENFSQKKIRIVVVSIVVTISLLLAYLLTLKTSSSHANQSVIDTAFVSKTIIQADSFKDCNPDSSIYLYKKAIHLLQTSPLDTSETIQLANSYYGLAYNYSQTGKTSEALKYDSLVLALGRRINNLKLQSKGLTNQAIVYFKQGDSEKSDRAFQSAETLARRVNDLPLLIKICSNRAQIQFFKGNVEVAKQEFEKSLKLALYAKNNPLIAGGYMNLGVFYSCTGNNGLSLVYYEKALPIFIQLNDVDGEMLSLQNIGIIYYNLNHYDRAIDYYSRSILLAKRINNPSSEAKGYHNLAETYARIGDSQTAIHYYFKSLKIKEQLGDKVSIATDLNSIGGYFHETKDYNKAKIYYLKSLQLNKEAGNLQGISMEYDNIGNLYSDTKQQDSALAYYNRSLKIHRQIEDPAGLALLYLNFGLVYAEKGEYAAAEKALNKALNMKTELADQEGMATVDYCLANLYLKQSDATSGNTRSKLIEQAIRAAKLSYKIAKAINVLPVMKEASDALRNAYTKKGDFKLALHYSQKFSEVRDSLTAKGKAEAIAIADIRWNVEKKQREIERLHAAQRLNEEVIRRKEAESRKQKIYLYSGLVIFALALLSAFVFALYYRKRKDALFQKQMLNIAQLRIQIARNTMSPHFFFNILATLGRLNNQEELFRKTLRNLTHLLRKVVENIEKSVITLDEELSNVKSYVELQQLNFDEELEVDYLINARVQLDQRVPVMVLQIPVENAIKHGLASLEGKKKLIVGVTQTDEHLILTVEDHGIGLRASAGKSTGTGSGLKILLQTIHFLNADQPQKIDFAIDELSEFENKSGTRVTVSIPLNFDYKI